MWLYKIDDRRFLESGVLVGKFIKIIEIRFRDEEGSLEWIFFICFGWMEGWFIYLCKLMLKVFIYVFFLDLFIWYYFNKYVLTYLLGIK